MNEGQTATNPQTGERIVLRGGQWVPMGAPQAQTPSAPQHQPQRQAAPYTGPTDAASLMPALIAQESGGRAGIEGPQTRYGRAIGRTQMLPATAQEMAGKLGLPYDESLLRGTSPEASVYQDRLGQAYLEQGLQTTGNVRDGLMYYHGGPDRSLWGPKTQAYADEVLARMGNGQVVPSQAQPEQQADPSFQEGQTATNPETGERRIFQGGQWVSQTAEGSSQANPIDLTGRLYQDLVDALKQGAWVRAQNGEVYQLPGDAFTANTRPADEAQGGNVFLRRPNLEDRIGAFASAAAEQIPFLDESVAATTGLLSGQGYNAMRQAQFVNRDLLNQTNRGERVAGGFAGFGATLALPGVASAGKYVSQGANRFDQARRAMQVGGAGGGLFGFANTDGDLGDRTVGGGVGAGSGIVAGPLGDELARALPNMTRRIGSGFSEAGARVGRGFGLQPRDAVVTPAATNNATDFVRRLVEQSGRDLSANPALAMGKPITAAEAIGPNAVSQVAALSRRSGRAGDLAQDVLGSRAADQSARIIEDLSRSSGRTAGEAQDAVNALAAQSRQAASPLYEQAYQAQNVSSATLSSLMNRPSMKSAMNKAVAIAREEGRNPEDLGFVVNRIRTPGGGWTEEVSEVATPSMQTWDYVKRGLDDVLEGYRDPTSRRMNLDTAGRAAEATRQALRSELTNPNTPWGPAYRAALEAGGDAPRLEGAFREGPNLFSSTVNERTFRNRVGAMGEADRGAMLSGIVDDLYNKARTGRINIRQLRTPAAREKLSLLMGGDQADDFVNRLAAEADMARLGGRMAPGTNSITSEVQEAIREQDRGVGILSDLSRNLENSPGPVSALMKTGTEAVMAPIAGFVRGVQTPAPQATRDEIARLLLGSPEDLNGLLGAQLRQPPRATRGAYTGGLFGGRAGASYATSRQ